ncbi:MAG: hypothetical protein LBS52_01005 [Dysgonamonadaceae bacterium]|jgi:hypothetical protein|nr:hypothetical protein [Dysgonamonadaceae bacterium]
MNILAILFGLLICLVLALIIANAGAKRNIGFGWALFLGIWLSPIVSLIAVLLSDKIKPDEYGTVQKKWGCLAPLMLSTTIILMVAYIFYSHKEKQNSRKIQYSQVESVPKIQLEEETTSVKLREKNPQIIAEALIVEFDEDVAEQGKEYHDLAEKRRKAEEERLLIEKVSKEKTTSRNSDNEEIVDLNDYVGTPDDGTDWNYIGFEDEKEAKEFEELLKSKGIYWSNSKNAWVKRKEKQPVGSSAGAMNLSYNVAGRSAKNLPRPIFKNEFEEGIVVIDIEVTPEGKVANAKLSDKTTVNNNSVKQACLSASLQAEFSKLNLSANQSGSISYYCRTK